MLPPQPLAQNPQNLIPNFSGAAPWPPQPLLVTDFGAGMISMNYRGEPLPLRVNKPLVTNPDAAPDAADLSSSFRSIPRLVVGNFIAIAAANVVLLWQLFG